MAERLAPHIIPRTPAVRTRDPIAELLAAMDAELATIAPAERQAWLAGVDDTIEALQGWVVAHR